MQSSSLELKRAWNGEASVASASLAVPFPRGIILSRALPSHRIACLPHEGEKKKKEEKE